MDNNSMKPGGLYTPPPTYEKQVLSNPRKPVDAAIARLEASIGSLEAEIHILNSRLEPILSVQPPIAQVASPAPHEGSSPAVIAIMSLNEHVCNLVDVLNRTTNRLEV